MDKLNEIINSVDLSKLCDVDLSQQGLTDLTDLVPILAEIPNLKSLDLSHNSLEFLPVSLEDLKTIEFLDISHNSFKDVSLIISGLSSLPNLISLNINFEDVVQEDEILIVLENLRIFNGISLVDNVVFANSPVQSSTSTLQQAKESFKQAKEEFKRMNFKPIQFVEDDSIIDLLLSQESEVPEDLLVKFKEIFSYNSLDLSEDDLKQTTSLIQRIIDLCNLEDRNSLRESFSNKCNEIFSELRNFVNSDENFMILSKFFEILITKYKLYDLLQTYMINYLTNGELFNIFVIIQKSLRDTLISLRNLFYNAILIFQKKNFSQKEENSKLKTDTESLIQAAENLTIAKDSSKFQLEAELRDAKNEIRQLKEEMGMLNWQNEKLRIDNRKLQLKLHRKNGGYSVTEASRVTAKTDLQGAQRGYVIKEAHTPVVNMSTSVSPSKQHRMNEGLSGAKSGKNYRSMTIKQVHDMITEIIGAKEHLDSINKHASTMKEHVTTYLNQKYGLRTLINEMSFSLGNAVSRNKGDALSRFFGAIYNNECDENFYYVLQQVEDTIHSLVLVYYRNKHPNYPEAKCRKMTDKTLGQHGLLVEELYQDIIAHLYEEDTALTIIMGVRELTNPQNKIKAPDFINTLQRHALEAHITFLKTFVDYWRRYDYQNVGFVTKEDFEILCSSAKLNLPQLSEEIERVNFSEAVDLLSQPISEQWFDHL
ncbi:hypothetical protein PCE1_000671 [Barthelona sp. PCE]